MSEPRLIEPLLSEYIMGEAISDRCGVRCCPAMHQESEEKYMVKILSIPASEKQLDAMLLSGACKSKEHALRYFHDLAEEAVEEAKLLQTLSRLEGFQSYDAWQIEPMEDGTGYDVYLLMPYGQTLERMLRRNGLTHLAAVNLGLDLCAALSVCRRNDHLYVDLKPENIFLSDTHGYLIGDLGFLKLRSLKYASLPDKYRSAYTAPEIVDAYSSLNTTLDIYAVGLILYQVYNNNQLPNLNEPLTPPEYADYEMAEIILKACAADPTDRWQDPQELAQALVSYMQRNRVNDDPIIPPPPVAEPELPEPEEEPAEEQVEEIPIEEPISEPAVGEIAEEEPSSSTVVEEDAPIEDLPEADEDAEEEMEQIVIEGFVFDDDPAEELDIEDLEDASISDEVSLMLAQADELIAHKAPDPVVAPEAIEVPMPEPILPEPEEQAEPEPEEISQEPSEPADEEADEAEQEDICEEEPPRHRRKFGWVIAALLALLILAGVAFGMKQYYENEYLQNINAITLESAEDWLTVKLDTTIDNSLLTVVCTDTYGNKLTESVEGNQATFTSLPSGTTYKITVTISGKHELTGNTTATYTTPMQTSIVGFSGIIGDSDGSVILNFSVQGPDASGWLVKYTAEGEEEKTAVCSGHMALITGLTPGKTYTFHLVPQNDLYVISGDTLEFTASKVICAENLTIQGFENGRLHASWEIPAGETVAAWTVRCFNSTGTDLTFTVTDPYIAIEGLDVSQGYTLEVLANGMTVSKWVSISANSVTFKEMTVDDSVPGQLTVYWNYEGTAPENGWNVICTVDGSAPTIVNCQDASFTLTNLVPGGHYTFDLSLPADISIYGATGCVWDVPPATMFQSYGITAELMLFKLCLAPAMDDWTWEDIAEEAYTSTFLPTDGAALVIQLTEEYETSPDLVTTTFIIRDQNGSLISQTHDEQTWTSMWYQGYCELNLPALPASAGDYTLEIYLNGAYITLQPIEFTIS